MRDLGDFGVKLRESYLIPLMNELSVPLRLLDNISMAFISPEHTGWQNKRDIGSGAMGDCYAFETMPGRKRVAKRINSGNDAELSKEFALLLVISVFGLPSVLLEPSILYIPEDKSWYIAMEDLQADDTDNTLYNCSDSMTMEEKLIAAVDIADLMNLLHHYSIHHNDLTSVNIMLCQNTRRVKVIDFGHANTQNTQIDMRRYVELLYELWPKGKLAPPIICAFKMQQPRSFSQVCAAFGKLSHGPICTVHTPEGLVRLPMQNRAGMYIIPLRPATPDGTLCPFWKDADAVQQHVREYLSDFRVIKCIET